MKKSLLGTTAFVVASAVASGASAQSLDDRIRTLEEAMLMGSPNNGFDVVVSGYAQGGVFVQDTDPDTIGEVIGYADATGMEDYAKFGVKMGGAEVRFSANTWIYDRKLRLGGRVELSGFTTRDQVDETYIWLQSKFGRLIFGADDDVYNKMHYSVPFPSLNGVDSPNYRYTVATAVRPGTNSSLAGDANKVSYFTPRMSGFQFGISYTPHNGNRNGEQNGFGAYDLNNVSLENVLGVGTTFRGQFSGFWIGASAGWQSGDSNITHDPDGPDGVSYFPPGATGILNENRPPVAIQTNPSNLHFGGSISKGSWKIGGAYAVYEGHGSPLSVNLGRPFSPTNPTLVDNYIDISDRVRQIVWSIGVAYSTGPWTLGVGYLQSEGEGRYERPSADGGLIFDTRLTLKEASPKTTVFGFGASYELATGMTIAVDFAATEDDNGFSGDDKAVVESVGGGLIIGINF
ncbi:MAG: porin [Hyphomicrobiales bacterium]|nr:porin [Hyphomicrobiales bacterium]MCY4032999.1 porin [Hyphomicrobiales bacterium]MCY4039283.1 porin [Hyphomicrobiales bacterium]